MIKLNNLNKKFIHGNHSINIFKDANLQIKMGELIAITGRSGSGKSTLLKILSGLDINYTGDYYFVNKKLKKDISSMADFRLKNIGIITQNYQLLTDRTCNANIAFPLKCMKENRNSIKKKVTKAMELLNISRFQNEYPYNLSGGQCQRVAIARAVVKQPKILIADEPTGALDIDAEYEVLEALKMIISKDCSVIIATHSDVVASWCNKIYEINNHKIMQNK